MPDDIDAVFCSQSVLEGTISVVECCRRSRVGGVGVDEEASCRGLWRRRVEVDSGVTRVEFVFVEGVVIDGFKPAVSSVNL